MNEIKTIVNVREVGGDCFRLVYVRKSNLYLKDYINKFNLEDYWIFKSTGNQRQVSVEEFLDFRYASYILFKKDLYDLQNIKDWIEFVNTFLTFTYLVKPFPPEYVKQKIRLINE